MCDYIAKAREIVASKGLLAVILVACWKAARHLSVELTTAGAIAAILHLV